MSKTVTLQLCSGEIFKDIVIESLDQTLAEFLDLSLKQLEVSYLLIFMLCGRIKIS